MKSFASIARVTLLQLMAVTFITSAGAVVFNADTSIGALDTSYDGQDVVVSNCTVTIDGEHAFNSVRLADGGVLTHTLSSTGLRLTITNDLNVELGGAINLTGRGFEAGTGTGAGASTGSILTGAGAGHAGCGGISSSNAIGGTCYGLMNQPTTFGSGGGPGVGGLGGNGGGAIKLTVGGATILDGLVFANGSNATNSRAGGGSGGSFWIATQTLSGNGTITANGGNGEPIHGGGGGGGRIAIVCETNLFSGVMTAYGGLGWRAGGAGTVFTKSAADNGLLIVDNNGQAGTNSIVTITNQADVMVRGNAVVIPGSWNSGNVTIASNSFVIPTTTTITMTMTGNCIVETGAGVLAAGKGSGPGQGTGAGGSTPGGGGGHGGRGGYGYGAGATGSNEHGIEPGPTTLGSGGGGLSSSGGFGGGAVRLIVTGNLQLDGNLTVNGTTGLASSSGGGSGGSVWLTLGGLSGAGSISASGGNGIGFGGGGGGGRVAIYCSSNTFAGTISAFGGVGTNSGGAGTIYLRMGSTRPLLIVDNGGKSGTTTTLSGNIGSGDYQSLTIAGGARANPSVSGLIAGNLFIKSNSWLYGSSLSTTGLLTIEASGGIDLDGLTTGGFGNASGFGHGAGHGGTGGRSAEFNGVNGSVYGNPVAPNQGGSNGGVGFNVSGSGGIGGGVVNILGVAVMRVDGIISVNGTAGLGSTAGSQYTGGGGGSGGSVYIRAKSLSGTGKITANGGSGANGGGGGGGGRIAIYCDTNTFTGTISAFGGSGYVAGGAGAIYFNSYLGNPAFGSVLVDNNHQSGTNSSFSSTGTFGLVVQNGGRASVAGNTSQTFSNILIYSNAWLVASDRTITATNITVHAGGGIIADGVSLVNNGGSSGGNRGAGHGGYGARGTNSAIAGGLVYGSVTQPVTSGSYVSSSVSSPGGGWIKLNVSGNLVLNGRVSADAGLVTTIGNGGGSGGSVWLNVGTLSGSGLISANGGDCVNAGGGGGGRIAVYFNSNSFSGNISVRGGNGFNTGGAGTIYTKANSIPVGQILVDGGGLVGEQTPLSTSYSLPNLPFNLTVSGGATVLPIPPFPILSNLWVGAGGTMTMRTNETNLFLHVLRDVTISAGGSLAVDGKGFAPGLGIAPGVALAGTGAGGGYGGAGGNSSAGAAGGTNFGSATKPVDRGSGGGSGANSYFGGSEGGGAVQMIVGGTLRVDGALSANGNPGLQDDSGGGSGGSVWISAGAVTGSGNLSATGGDGDLFGGGGGGGGRIAIYSPTNTFAGSINVSGGSGANAGQAGSLFISSNLFTFLISGTVTNLQGNPQEGAVIQPLGFAATTTDSNGNYVLEFPAGWSGAVTPSLGTNVFVPNTRSYASLNSDITDASYLTVASVTPVLSSGLSGTNLVFNWSGVPGVTYQAYWSTNLSAWSPLGSSFPGANGLMQLLIPANDQPQKFVRVQATY